jgi:hypothetical protein
MAVAPFVPLDDQETEIRCEVEAELERICSSSCFHTSRRSCEFLRYVVQTTLDGRSDSLKERAIGMDLLGRNVSYDPGSDATVRVRANDVRKRLVSYYSSCAERPSIQIILPTGTYVPQFARAAPETPQIVPDEAASISPVEESSEIQKRVWLRKTIMVAVVTASLLLCGFLVRYRLQSHQNYRRFWNRAFSGRQLVLLSISRAERDRLASGLYPLVWMAGRYGIRTILSSGPLTGATTDTFTKVRLSSGIPEEWKGEKHLHWQLDSQNSAFTLTVRRPSGKLSTSLVPHAALLTILPESPAILYVQSTDEDSLRKLFEELTEADRFPRAIRLPLPTSAPFQVLLTLDTAGHATIQVSEP